MTTGTVTDRFNQDTPGVNIMPPSVFLICLITGGVLELLSPSDLPFLPTVFRAALGTGLGTAGFAFMMFAHERFKHLGTNVPTNLPATTLVVQGAYRYSRNPMYLGGSAFFIGIGLALGSSWMVATYIPLGIYLSRYVIPREEAYMRRAFGQSYQTYCNRVRRWI